MAEAIDPAWTSGRRFELAFEIEETAGIVIYVRVCDGGAIQVSRTAVGKPVATISSNAHALICLLAGKRHGLRRKGADHSHRAGARRRDLDDHQLFDRRVDRAGLIVCVSPTTDDQREAVRPTRTWRLRNLPATDQRNWSS